MDSNMSKILLLFSSLFVLNKFITPDVKENFGMIPARTWKVNRVYGQPGADMFDVPGNYQAMLSPRNSGGINYGAFIRYNTPNEKHLALDPNDPLMHSNMAYKKTPTIIKEGYCGAQPNEAPSGRQQAPMMNNSYTEATDLLPVSGMGGQVVNALGEGVQEPVIYDRYVYANQKSRLYGQGDPIRGDLPIVPLRNEWFRPSATPSIDLRSGALMTMGGVDLSTTKELLALQSASAGGLLGTGSGINYSVQQSPYTTGGSGDLQVSAFP